MGVGRVPHVSSVKVDAEYVIVYVSAMPRGCECPQVRDKDEEASSGGQQPIPFFEHRICFGEFDVLQLVVGDDKGAGIRGVRERGAIGFQIRFPPWVDVDVDKWRREGALTATAI